jgi:hypothetical protein
MPSAALLTFSEAVVNLAEAGHLPEAFLIMELFMKRPQSEKCYDKHLDKWNSPSMGEAAMSLIGGFDRLKDDKYCLEEWKSHKEQTEFFVSRLESLGTLARSKIMSKSDTFNASEAVITDSKW